MASSFTPAYRTSVGNLLLRSGSLSSPGQLYVALATAVSADNGTITEVSGGSYARQAVTFDVPVDGVFLNEDDVIFPQATANWGTLTDAVLYDAVTGGNAVAVAPLDVEATINSGMIYELLAGELAVRF